MSPLPITYDSKQARPLFEPDSVGTHQVLNEQAFKRMLAIERNRAERSKEAFLLILFEASQRPQRAEKAERVLNKVASHLLSSIRVTDVIGWHNERTSLGVVYTGLPITDTTRNSISAVILNKVTDTLQRVLTPDQFKQVSISFHLFPDEWNRSDPGTPGNRALYPDLTSPDNGRRTALVVKRAIDVVVSGLILILIAPLFMVIALAIKASSKGPVFFKQERVGHYGQHFTFLKFRSMFLDTDHRIHKEFVTKFIADDAPHLFIQWNWRAALQASNG